MKRERTSRGKKKNCPGVVQRLDSGWIAFQNVDECV